MVAGVSLFFRVKKDAVSPDLVGLDITPSGIGFKQCEKLQFSPDTAIIGFDSEYVSGAVAGGDKNLILSYQAYAIIPSQHAEWFWALDVENSERLKLEDLLVATLLEGKRLNAFQKWPRHVGLVAHWTLADLTSFSDFKAIRTQFDGVRKTYITIGEGNIATFHDVNRNKHVVEYFLRDTLLLAPSKGGSLASIGQLLGLDKIEVPTSEKKDLRRLKACDPKLYWRYAMTDAEIAAAYFLRIVKIAQFMLSSSEVNPLTLGSLAPLLVFKIWKDLKIDRHQVLGTRLVKTKKTGSNGTRTRTEIRDLEKKIEFISIAQKGYMGGRNEAFWFGLSPSGTWYDYDLSGAYPCSMSCMGIPLWQDLRLAASLDEYTPDVMGVAHVEFRFPDHVRFPCIPVQTATGLIFPRSGSCWATSPEIWLARQLGGKLEFSGAGCAETALGGFVLPMDYSVRPFDVVASYIHEKRHEFKLSDPLLSEMYKQLGNSVYGKTAQAVKPKNVLDTRSGEMKPLPPSAITNDYLALHTTGLVRAIIGEMLNAIPESFDVISITTDGFITNLPDTRLGELCQGRLASMFIEAKNRALGSPTLLITKHRPQRVACFRTRGQMTVDDLGNLARAVTPGEQPCPDEELVLARGGIKTKAAGVHAANNEVVSMFVERQAGQKYPSDRMRGFRQIYDASGDLDLNRISTAIGYTMDFDWKRMPTAYGEQTITGVPHLWFSTKPVENLQEYERLREQWRNFAKGGRVLKRAKDWEDFQDYLRVACPKVRRRRGGADTLQTAKKCFLRAYTKGLWGVSKTLKNHELARKLTAGGFPTTVHDVENAARRSAAPLEHCVEATAEVMSFLALVATLVPEFPSLRLLKA